AYRRHERIILEELDREGVTDKTARNLAYQNRNPARVPTSGLEEHAEKPFVAAGKLRQEGRVAWGGGYNDDRWCVFGHYWRVRLGDDDDEDLFAGTNLHQSLGNGRAMCIDYSAGKRWIERLQGVTAYFRTSLAALRWPEKTLVLDDGRIFSLRDA